MYVFLIIVTRNSGDVTGFETVVPSGLFDAVVFTGLRQVVGVLHSQFSCTKCHTFS